MRNAAAASVQQRLFEPGVRLDGANAGVMRAHAECGCPSVQQRLFEPGVRLDGANAGVMRAHAECGCCKCSAVAPCSRGVTFDGRWCRCASPAA
eukprot:1161350-Pelagomonas_calceolata.AAC.8